MLLAHQIVAILNELFLKNEWMSYSIFFFFCTDTSPENMMYKIYFKFDQKMAVVMPVANQIATCLYQLHKLFLTNCFCVEK